MGNIFLHSVQMIDLLRENLGWFVRQLWKRKSIDAFMVVTQSWAGQEFIHAFTIRNLILQDRSLPHIAGFAYLSSLSFEFRRGRLH